MPDSTRIREAMIFTADSGRNIQFPERHPHHPPVGGGAPENASAPHSFGALDLSSTPNILAHAFFRESPKSGEGLPDWAGHRMFRDSAGACDHPYIIRLVEWDGHPAEVLLKLPGPVALAAKTNLLGEVAPHIPGTAWLDIIPDIEPPSWAKFAKLRGRPIPWSALRFTMRPREIATIYADLVLGRKEWRDLDAKREVWATVHRDPGASS
jgi:alpha-mannosidase